MNDTEIFRVDSLSWVPPMFLGSAIFVTGHFSGLNLFYFHYYFFLVGIVCFFLSYQKYAEINNQEIVLFYGFPVFKNCIKLSWEEISFVKPQSVEKKGFAKNIRFGGVPFKYNEERLLIQLKSVNEKQIKEIKQKYAGVKKFQKRFEISNEGHAIILKAEPKEGFAKLLKTVAKYTQIKNFDPTVESSGFDKAFFSFGMLLPMVLATLFVLWIMNTVFS